MTSGADESQRRKKRKNTGPRSAEGKARAARNALSHGLSVPLHVDPVEKGRIQALAGNISTNTENERVRALVEQIAEAQLEIIRVRKARQKILDDPIIITRRFMMKDFRAITRGAKTDEEIEKACDLLIECEQNGIVERPDLSGVEKISFLAGKLASLDRYERRALSRRKFLIREYDALRVSGSS